MNRSQGAHFIKWSFNHTPPPTSTTTTGGLGLATTGGGSGTVSQPVRARPMTLIRKKQRRFWFTERVVGGEGLSGFWFDCGNMFYMNLLNLLLNFQITFYLIWLFSFKSKKSIYFVTTIKLIINHFSLILPQYQ